MLRGGACTRALLIGAAIVLVVVALAAVAAQRRGRGGDRFRGPYNLGLTDSPRYYPHYEARDVMAAWDGAGRCSAYCSASEDGGCAVSCR